MILFLACTGEEGPPLATAPEVWVEARKVEEGAPVVLHAPTGVPMPVVEGLTFTAIAASDEQTVWHVTGDKGSYVLDLGTTRLYLDLGVDGPTGGPMDGLTGLGAPPPPVWPYVIGGVVGVAALTGGGWYLWKRFQPKPVPPPPEPPDLVARREWAALRARTDLAPEAQALGLSGVVRRYLEAVHRWPATSRTTREIVDALAGQLTAEEHLSATRLMRAMDLVKFAERADVAALFGTFDQDFERILARGRARA